MHRAELLHRTALWRHNQCRVGGGCLRHVRFRRPHAPDTSCDKTQVFVGPRELLGPDTNSNSASKEIGGLSVGKDAMLARH